MNQLRSVLAGEFIQQSITSGKRFVLQQEFRMITEWRIEHVRPNPMRFPDLVRMPCDHISVITIAGEFLAVKHDKQPVPKMIGIRIVYRGRGRWRVWRLRFSLSGGQDAPTHGQWHEGGQDNRRTNRSPNRMVHINGPLLRSFILLCLYWENAPRTFQIVKRV